MGYFNSIYAADLPHRAVAVYMYLKDRTNKDGVCWPSIKTIARELHLSRATVQRALNDLCAAGYLSGFVLAADLAVMAVWAVGSFL